MPHIAQGCKTIAAAMSCVCVIAGIKRVALLDFDVHHGNGTEACVAATAPSLRKYSFKTPFSEGSQTFPVFSPWLDTDDADNILFARWACCMSLTLSTTDC